MYLDIGAAFTDDPLWMKAGLRRRENRRTLVWHDRLIPFVDPRDVAEAAGRLLLSPNQRHVGQLHALNKGEDLMRYSDVARLMREVWEVDVGFDSSREAFFREYAWMGEERLGFVLEIFEYEERNEVVWARNDFVKRAIGRKPITVRDWLVEHREEMLG